MMTTLHSKVWLGTSGIVLPGNKSTFPLEYQDQTRLHYYSHLFNSLEINSSFYKIPKNSTFKKWSTEVHVNFNFTVKLWRAISHAKNLMFTSEDVARFVAAIQGLGDKCGCVLVQLPASTRIDSFAQLEKLLNEIKTCKADCNWTLAVEFRHESWYQPKVYTLLSKFNATIVLHDMPRSTPPIELLELIASPYVYFRFHGPSGQYTGSYSNQFIDEYAIRIKSLRHQGRHIFIYFNNTIGSALQNAQRMQDQLA